MSDFERLEGSKVKLTMDVSPDVLERGLQAAYLKNRGKINMPGFRQGRAPRKLIEKTYGKEIFYEDAVNVLLPELYEAALEEHSFDVVSRPEFDIEKIDAAKGATILAEFFVKPEITLTNYLGLKYKKPNEEAEDAEIDAVITQEQQKNSRIVTVDDRAVLDGDIAIIDFEGFVDGVAFEGGKGEDYELKIGSKSFIDTFEDQIIGKNIGDEFDVNVTFPDPYGNENLAGKPAVFKVKVNGIQFSELPELNDDFAQEFSEFDTFAEYKASIKETIEKDKKERVEADIENQLVMELVKILDETNPIIPESMFENEIENMTRDFTQRLAQQGMRMDMYLNYMGSDIETLRESFRPNAINNVKGRLAIEAAARNENFEVSDTDVSEEFDKMAEVYRMERDKIEASMSKRDIEMLKKDIQVKKTLKKIKENAVAE